MSRSSHRARKRVVAGLEQIEPGYSTYRYDAPAFDAVAVKVFPGEHYVTSAPNEMPVTVLGSCVAACIRDPLAGIGGMNHFMLPEGPDDRWGNVSAGMRYGNVAMERLINAILKLGAQRTDLEVKLVGGAKVLDAMTDIGARNIQFVRDYVRAEGFAVIGEDLGDVYPRKVIYHPATGIARVKRLTRTDRTVVADERRYIRNLDRTIINGEIEMFNEYTAARTDRKSS